MISELHDMINIADSTNNQKAKKILLKIAESPENKQKDLLTLVKVLINPNDADKILDDYAKTPRRRR
jgi:hypothetical protein